eukprot:6183461-Pleurochrysis_carterae.AAC.3
MQLSSMTIAEIYMIRIHNPRAVMGLTKSVNTLAAHSKHEASKSGRATPRNDATNSTRAPTAKVWCVTSVLLGMCCRALQGLLTGFVTV